MVTLTPAHLGLLQNLGRQSQLRICATRFCAQANAGKATRNTHNDFPNKQIVNNREFSVLEAVLLTFTKHLGHQSHFVTNQLLLEVSRVPNETRSPSSESNLGNTHQSHLL